MSNEHVPPPAPQDPASKPPKKGDWLTAKQIAESTRRSWWWVKKQLAEHFPEEGNVQQVRGGCAVMHYPPSILPKLQKLADRHRPAKAGEIRLDDKGRVVVHYPPEVLRQLKKLAGENPPVEE